MPPTQTVPEGISQYMHDVITGEGFTYRIDWRHDFDAIRDEDTARIQIRAEGKPVMPHVRGLAESYKAGAKIELFAVTEDGYRPYGNHRYEALKLNGTPVVPVIVINVSAGDADDETLRRLRIVGIRENARSQLPNSKATKEMAVVLFREEGWDNTRIARELGVPANRVAEIVAVDKGRHALHDLGITRPLTRAVVGAIGRLSEDMNRQPFHELARLAVDADLTKTEINTLAKQVKDSGSDTDGVNLITTERQALRTRVSGSNPVGPSFAAQLRQKLGFIVGKEANAQLLVETSAAHATEHLDMVERSINVLTAVRDLMRAAQEAAA